MPLFREDMPNEWKLILLVDPDGHPLPQVPVTWKEYYDRMSLDWLGEVALIRGTQAHLNPEQICMRRLGRWGYI